jgi:hypothetical protein
MLNWRAVTVGTIVGSVLQLLMVVSGHWNTSIAGLFAVGGMTISLLAGWVARWAGRQERLSGGKVTLTGVIAGGVSALIGILVSFTLDDVPASILLLGTVGSMVTGVVGAWLGQLLSREATAAALTALITGLSSSLSAQTTAPSRIETDTHAAATVGDFGWMIGSWEGRMKGGTGTAHVVLTIRTPA